MPIQTRQLAAIMPARRSFSVGGPACRSGRFTDIVRYAALMGKDSGKGMYLMRQRKQIPKPRIEKHNGTWLKEMGDGAMV